MDTSQDGFGPRQVIIWDFRDLQISTFIVITEVLLYILNVRGEGYLAGM